MKATESRDTEAFGSAPDVDEQGVDRAQIRRMLARSPSERLSWLEDFMASLAEIRAHNEKRQVR
jgi:hypothetical protein